MRCRDGEEGWEADGDWATLAGPELGGACAWLGMLDGTDEICCGGATLAGSDVTAATVGLAAGTRVVDLGIGVGGAGPVVIPGVSPVRAGCTPAGSSAVDNNSEASAESVRVRRGGAGPAAGSSALEARALSEDDDAELRRTPP